MRGRDAPRICGRAMSFGNKECQTSREDDDQIKMSDGEVMLSKSLLVNCEIVELPSEFEFSAKCRGCTCGRAGQSDVPDA